MTSNLKELASILDYEYDSLKVAIMRNLKSKFPEKQNNSDWKKYLLTSIGYKNCSLCSKILPISSFGVANTDNSGIRSTCKSCSYKYQVIYKRENRELFRFHESKRRALLKDNHQDIKNFYLNCPEGHEVDHIIPLQGKNVCGLHVLGNLQYLTATENRKKSNKFEVKNE